MIAVKCDLFNTRKNEGLLSFQIEKSNKTGILKVDTKLVL